MPGLPLVLLCRPLSAFFELPPLSFSAADEKVTRKGAGDSYANDELWEDLAHHRPKNLRQKPLEHSAPSSSRSYTASTFAFAGKE
jgi:hypothetical protein